MAKQKSIPFSVEMYQKLGKPYVHTKSGNKVTDLCIYDDMAEGSLCIVGIVHADNGKCLLLWDRDGKIGSREAGREPPAMFSAMDLMIRG